MELLSSQIARMGGVAEAQLAEAVEALAQNDHSRALKVIQGDDVLDEMDMEISAMAQRVIALRQPMAVDLRKTIAAIRIGTDLERIGDLARNIAREVMKSGASFPRQPLGGVLRMGRQALGQIKKVMDACAEGDSGKALEVWKADRELDEIYIALLREMMTYMLEDPKAITPSLNLLFAARHIERAGDHATNIAEMVIYANGGDGPGMHRPKGKPSAS